MGDDEVRAVEIPGPSDPDDPTLRIEHEHRAADAPWGYKADGTPYKVDPSRYAKRDAARRRGSAPKASKGGSKAKGSSHRDAVIGVIQIVSLPVAAMATRSDAYAADLVTLNAFADPIADAFESLAGTNKGVAQALDKLGEVGPYGLVIGAMAPLILQVATNHGLIPPGTAGTVEPSTLLAEFVESHGNGQVPA